MSQTELTADELTETITGYDEEAIAREFGGFDLYADAEAKPVTMLRALIFVHKRHDPATSDKAAFEGAMGMPLGKVQDYFADDNEANPADPDTDAGKGAEPLTSPPSDSPTSASEPASLQVSTAV